MILKADKGEVTAAEHYALRELQDEKELAHNQYWRGFESAVSTMKALVNGRIKAYTEHGLENQERLGAFRTVMDNEGRFRDGLYMSTRT